VVMSAGRIVAAGAPTTVLTPALLAEVYGVDAGVIAHPGGLSVDVLGRRG